jgi:hypothetical protein
VLFQAQKIRDEPPSAVPDRMPGCDMDFTSGLHRTNIRSDAKHAHPAMLKSRLLEDIIKRTHNPPAHYQRELLLYCHETFGAAVTEE